MDLYLYFTFRIRNLILPRLAISGYKASSASCGIGGFYVRVPFGEIVARTDEGLPWEREGFNCDRRTGDFLRSLDPHVGAVLRQRGCNSFHCRKSLFFSLFSPRPVPRQASSNRRAFIIPCTSKATRPDASRTRRCIQYPPSSFFSSFLPCTSPLLFLSCSPMFHLFLRFDELHENLWKTRTYSPDDGISWFRTNICLSLDTIFFETNARKHFDESVNLDNSCERSSSSAVFEYMIIIFVL